MSKPQRGAGLPLDLGLAALIVRALARGSADDALRLAFVREVDAATRRLPDCWFELGRRAPESVESLAHRVLVRSERSVLGRFPFSGRTLFLATAEEDWGDAPVRYHAFRARLSVMREVLRSDRAFNLARDPVARAADDRYRALAAALRRVAEPVEVPAHTAPQFRAPQAGLRVARDPALVRARMLAEGLPADVDTLVLRFLREVGQPLSVAALVEHLSPLLGALPAAAPDIDDVPEPSVGAGDPLTRRAVRSAVLRAWSDLGPEERALLRGVAEGDEADALMARVPTLNSRVAVTRAITRINQRFLGAVVAAIGGEAQPDAAPRALLELVLEVLLAVLPEVSDV
jgi:hypothetical protein